MRRLIAQAGDFKETDMSAITAFRHWVGGHGISQPRTVDSQKREIEAGDFRLELTDREAYLRGAKLRLSEAEFDLLRYLLTHRKMLVTPQTVLSTACGALNIRRNAFMENLMSLKKKLDEASGSDHYLHLEPWVLYEFDLTAD